MTIAVQPPSRLARLRGNKFCFPVRQHAALVPTASSARSCCGSVRSSRRGATVTKRLQRNYLKVMNLTDYTATRADEGVLRMPSRSELSAAMIMNVFGYPRALFQKYKVDSIIGAGSFGVVRKCQELTTGRWYAVKTISKTPKRGPPTPRYLLKLRTEVEVMQQLGSSLDAVNLRDIFEDNDSLHLVMELCEGGALLERITERTYSESYIARQIRCVLRFISQCHAKGIIYRDVKPDNFLFLNKEESSPLKATDFGLSIRHAPDEPKLSSRSGTPAYMAPELIQQCYDEKSDIWSVGMMTYQLLTGRFPFWEDVRNESLPDVWRAILYTELNWEAPELKSLSPSGLAFLNLLLNRDPSLRPSASAALEHPWVREAGLAPNLPLEGTVVQRLQRFATYTHLKQLVLRMIVDEMRADGSIIKRLPMATSVRTLFEELDADKSGTVTCEELAEGLRRQGYLLNDDEVQQLMAKIDINHDGSLVEDELLATLMDWNMVAKEPDMWRMYMEQAFQQMDIDGDGFISLDELLDKLPPVDTESLSSLSDASNPQVSSRFFSSSHRLMEAKRMLREADTNGDGRISKEEFFDLLKDNVTPDSLSLYDDRLAINSPPSGEF